MNALPWPPQVMPVSDWLTIFCLAAFTARHVHWPIYKLDSLANSTRGKRRISRRGQMTVTLPPRCITECFQHTFYFSTHLCPCRPICPSSKHAIVYKLMHIIHPHARELTAWYIMCYNLDKKLDKNIACMVLDIVTSSRGYYNRSMLDYSRDLWWFLYIGPILLFCR